MKNKQQIHKAKNAHDNEHLQWTRRSFLQTLGIGGVGGMFLGGNYISAAAMQPMLTALNEADNDRVLVLIRFAGGNDGLNTIVPLNYYDTYAQNRPNIYHRENTLISLSDEYAMPNFMEPLEAMWGDGKMKVVHGIGYENQSSSHFAGNDITATLNVDRLEDLETKGWLGRYFNNQYDDFLTNPPDKPLAIQIGSSSNLIFNYDELQYAYLVANPDQLESIAQTGLQFSIDNIDTQCKSGQQLQYLRNSANNTYKYAGAIHDAYISSTNVGDYDAESGLADQLSLVARMIKGNLGTKIYMVSIGGFDTHANQLEKHQELLTNVSNAVSAFYQDLEATGHDQNVLSMTFSEFGRRVYENGSSGTDHGKAAPSLLFGPALNGNGFAGLHPDLDNDITNNGNIEYTTDFRSLYGTVLSKWLCASATDLEVSLNGIFEEMDLGFECNSDTSTVVDEELDEETELGLEEIDIDQGAESRFSYSVFYEDTQTILKINNETTRQIDIMLFSMSGNRVGELIGQTFDEGEYTISVKEEINPSLSPGMYICKVMSNDEYVKKILIK